MSVFKGFTESNRPAPPKCSPQKFSTLSAYFCSCSCQYCYHIKQKYCIFFSPKAFCDCNTHKVLKRRLRLRPGLRPDLAVGAHDAPSDP